MPRFPPYPKRPHSTGQARISIGRKQVYLGTFGSPESWAKYRQLLEQWEVRGCAEVAPIIPEIIRATLTIGEAATRFMDHAEQHYPPPDDAGESRELGNYRDALRLLLKLHPDTLATAFGPRLLKAWLRAAAARWCRRVANRHLGRIKTFWRWCESEELVPAGSSHALATVRGLAEGEHSARERPEVPPAPAASIAAALPQLNPVARALVECLLLTAARPGELFRLTPGDINRTGEVELARGYKVQLGGKVWAYSPRKHKTSRKGKRRVILFGPRAQAVLLPLLEDRPADRPVFCPQDVRKRIRGRNPPGLRYDRRALNQAVRRACLRAGVAPFTPYSLRHSAATNLANEFGQDVAALILGHADLRTTGIYALPDLERAAKAIGEAG